jgi:hypothetical protein
MRSSARSLSVALTGASRGSSGFFSITAGGGSLLNSKAEAEQPIVGSPHSRSSGTSARAILPRPPPGRRLWVRHGTLAPVSFLASRIARRGIGPAPGPLRRTPAGPTLSAVAAWPPEGHAQVDLPALRRWKLVARSPILGNWLGPARRLKGPRGHPLAPGRTPSLRLPLSHCSLVDSRTATLRHTLRPVARDAPTLWRAVRPRWSP